MANCAKCGAKLPTFTFGEVSPYCPACLAQLRAEAAQAQTPAPPRRGPWDDLPHAATFGPQWFNITNGLILVNIAVFSVMVASGVDYLNPSVEHLRRWGANYGPFSLTHQHWRLLSCAFVHGGILHVAVNMWSLNIVARPIERIFGKFTTLMIYLLTGAGASMLSLARDPLRTSVGASGAIFGFVGVIISFFYFARLDLPRPLVISIRGWAVKIAVLNLIFGMLVPVIDNSAHLGGLLTGLLLGFLFGRSFQAPAEDRFPRQAWTLAAVALLLLALFPALVKFRAPALKLESERAAGQEELKRGDYQAALARFQKMVAQAPQDPVAHGLLGYTLAQLHRYDEAIREDQRALDLAPGFTAVEINMAAAYLGQGHPDIAVNLFKKNIDHPGWEEEDYRYYGQALRLTGDLGGAEIVLKKAIGMDPKDSQPHRDLALVYEARGRAAEAAAENKLAEQLSQKPSPLTSPDKRPDQH